MVATLALIGGAALGVRNLRSSPGPAQVKTRRAPTEAELAARERLVTVAPPKTQKTLLTSLADEGQVSPVCVFDGTAREAAAVLAVLRGAGVRVNVGVYGRDVTRLTAVIARAASEGHTVCSLGYRPEPGSSREALDRSYKATNRALFDVMARRPRFCVRAAGPSPPSADELDYAAINGMVTALATPGMASGPIPLFGSELEPRRIAEWIAASQEAGVTLVTLDQAFPPVLSGKVGPPGTGSVPER